MAIKFNEIVTKVKNQAPLTDEELEHIHQTEEYIDSVINSKFETQHSRIYIELRIPSFDYNVIVHKNLKFNYTRRVLMREELEKRYRNAGWEISVEIDDGLDGPNMSGLDYWVLSGKK